MKRRLFINKIVKGLIGSFLFAYSNSFGVSSLGRKAIVVPPYLELAITGLKLVQSITDYKLANANSALLKFIAQQLQVINEKLDLIFEQINDLPILIRREENVYLINSKYKKYCDILIVASQAGFETEKSKNKYFATSQIRQELDEIYNENVSVSDIIISNNVFRTWELITPMFLALKLEIEIGEILSKDKKLARQRLQGYITWFMSVCFEGANSLNNRLLSERSNLKSLLIEESGTHPVLKKFAINGGSTHEAIRMVRLLSRGIDTSSNVQYYINKYPSVVGYKVEVNSQYLIDEGMISNEEGIDVAFFEDPYAQLLNQIKAKVRIYSSNMQLAIRCINLAQLHRS